jgi:hypothetical protein
MANIKVEKNELILEIGLDDLKTIIDEATANIDLYKDEIAVIYQKMPGFDFTYFCFYAYSTYRLLEKAFHFSADEVGHFRLKAPESFYYAFYGMIATLHTEHNVKSGK